MTDQEQIRAIAILDGFNPEPNPDVNAAFGASHNKPEWSFIHQLPPYLTSYDAIIPVVQKQNYSTRLKMSPISFMTKPNKIAEALLRATNKWTTK